MKTLHLIELLFAASCLIAPGVCAAQDAGRAPETPQAAQAGIRPLDEARAKGAASSGKWSWSADKGLRGEAPRHGSAAFWASDETIAYDGTLRFRLVVGKRPDSSVFFRATFPGSPESVSGYSVSFDRRYVQMHRWDGGYPQEIGKRVKLARLPEKYDVAIAMKGTVSRIEVRDAADRKALATFSIDDARYHGSQTGYRVHRKQDSASSLQGFDFTPAASQSAPIPFNADAYLTHLENAYVFVPKDEVKSARGIKSCKPIKYAGIDGYEVHKCPHSVMMSLVDDGRMLPKGYYWSGPRNAFMDEEYRKAAPDLRCDIPMHCAPDAPLDPNRSAKDADMVQAYIDEYGRICPARIRHVRIETIGKTYLGHDIRAVVLSNAAEPSEMPKVLFNGAHHGMELLATDMAFDILEQLCESADPDARKQYDRMLRHAEIWVVPLVNLDGNDLFFHVSNNFGRKNGRNAFTHTKRPSEYPRKYDAKAAKSAYYRYHPNDIARGAGVDINRNYPLMWGATGEKSSSGNPRHYWYRGTAPASEPETQSMMNLFHVEQFVSSISFHTVSTRILSPYSIDALRNPPQEQDNAWQVALRMAAAAGIQVNGKPYEVVKNLYSVDGTDQDWFRMISGTYAYLLEGPLHNPVGEKRRSALEKSRPAWISFLDNVRATTTVSVKDEAGNPIIAQVRYSDEPHLNDERWYTRCDGTHRMLCFGPRQVTVTAPDGTAQTKPVQCQPDALNRVEFTFPVQPDGQTAPFDEKTLSLMGVDAICDLKNHTCPHLPALRYCLIDDKCVPAGTSRNSKKCIPSENNRGWSSK